MAAAPGRGPGAGGPPGRGPGRGPGGPMGPGGKGFKPKNSKQTIKRLLSYIEQDKYKMIVAYICVLVNTLAMLAGSYMLRPLINTYIAPTDGSRGDLKGLAGGLAVLGCIYLIGVAANYLQSRIMLTIAQGALLKIRTDLFEKMQDLPVKFYDTNAHGDLMSRFTNDVDTIGMMLSNTLIQLFSGVLSIVGTFGLMLYTNVYLTVVTVVMIPLIMRAGAFVAGRSRKYFGAQQAALGAMNGYIEETITGQKVVKVFCHEEIAEEEFDILNKDLRNKQIKAQFLGGLMGPVMNGLSQVNYAATACVGCLL